jgi:hypothetical protein
MRDLRELNLNEIGTVADRRPPTARQIAAVEQLIGASLPESYLTFLRFSNGGHPELDTFTLPTGEEWAVNTFFHIASDTAATDDCEDVMWCYHHRWPGAHRALLPIANDGGANLFCLNLEGNRHGEVVVQVHDEPGFPQVHLADSFDEFVDGLALNPDYI